MVELEALGGVGRRQRQRRVVAPQFGDPSRGGVRWPPPARPESRKAPPSRPGPPADRRSRWGAARRRPRSSAAVPGGATPGEAARLRACPRRAAPARPGAAASWRRRGPRRVRRPRPPRISSTRRSSVRSRSRGARNGRPNSTASAAAGSSSAFVRARMARVPPSSGQLSKTRRIRVVSSDPSGARISRPCATGPARIVLTKRSLLWATSRTARSTTGRRAAVVDRQIDAREPRQRIGQGKYPPHVGQSPAVDRLVVVADQEDLVAGAASSRASRSWRTIHVLRLVDQQVLALRAPAAEEGRPGLQQPERPRDQVVEVEAAGVLQSLFVGQEGAGDRARVGIGGHLGGGHADRRA